MGDIIRSTTFLVLAPLLCIEAPFSAQTNPKVCLYFFYGVGINDLKIAIPGAFLLVASIYPALRGHAKLTILQGFCLFVLAMLWYQVFSLNLMSIVVIVLGIAALIVAVYSIFKILSK